MLPELALEYDQLRRCLDFKRTMDQFRDSPHEVLEPLRAAHLKNPPPQLDLPDEVIRARRDEIKPTLDEALRDFIDFYSIYVPYDLGLQIRLQWWLHAKTATLFADAQKDGHLYACSVPWDAVEARDVATLQAIPWTLKR